MAVQAGLRRHFLLRATYHLELMVDAEQLLEVRLAIQRELMAPAVRLLGMIYLFF